MKVLWSLTLGIVLTALVVGCATVEQSDTPAASVATVIPTLTAEDTSAGAAPTVEAAPTPTVETAAEASVATVIPTLTAEDTSAGAAPTVEAAPTPTVETAAEASVATVIPTLTAEESLQQFVLCDRLLAKKSMLWGQAPGVIYSGNPQITGMIEPGDYVRFLMPSPNADGVIRIKVFPHDERVVGKTNNQVWISWVGLTRYRLDRDVFTCED